MKQKLILTLLLLLFAATTATAHDFEVDGIYYNIISDNEAAVTFKGTSYNSYISEYFGDVTIPDSVSFNGSTYSVTAIGDEAFCYCYEMTSVTIPNSVTTICDYAFDSCSGLVSMTIPNSVTTIGEFAFSDCIGLTSVTIGSSVTTIGNSAFNACFALTSVTIPNSVTDIGDWAFYSGTCLESVTIGSSVTTIGSRAFCFCEGLKSIKVDSGNTKYDSRENCNAIIETASNTLITGCINTVIPNSVTAIGNLAFEGCTGLTSVTIPSSVTAIGDEAFSYCSGLTDVYSLIEDPSKVSYGRYVFYMYSSSESFDYSGRTLHVPAGTLAIYQANWKWYPYFGTIVEMDPIVVPGDVDGDGKLTVSDVTELIDKILAGTVSIEDYPAADVNGDGSINIADVTELIDRILTEEP